MPEPMVIVLPQRVSIVEAAQLQGQLREASVQGGRLVIDGSGVTEIDTAGLQLLASLWRAGGAGADLRAPSQPFIRAAQLIGLDGLLQLSGRDPGPSGDVPR